DGAPLLDALRRPLQAFLTGNLPALGGLLPDPEVPPAGAGNWDDPWTVPLQPAGEAPVELLGRLEPAGPPLNWVAPDLDELDAGELDAVGLADAIARLAPYLGETATAVDPADPSSAGTASGALGA